MNTFTRKDFIKLGSLGILGLVLPTQEISAINRLFIPKNNPTLDDFKKAQELAKQAKVFFYKKEFVKAEELYLQSVSLAPSYIQFYDALDNVYGVKHNHTASIELFRKGLSLNPTKAQFYDRAARALFRLQTANPKLALQYSKSNKKANLLEEADALYKKAIGIVGAKKYLLEGVERINKAKGIGKKTKTEKNVAKKLVNSTYQSKLIAKTDTEIEGFIQKLETKKRTTLFLEKDLQQRNFLIQKRKKKYLATLLEKNKLDNAKSQVYAQRLFDVDATDSLSIFRLKKAYYKNHKYFDFISQKQRFADAKPSVYSYIGVVEAIQKAHQKNQATSDSLNSAVNILQMIMQNYNLTESTTVDVVDKLAIIYTMQNNLNDAFYFVETVLNNIKTSNPSVVNKLIYRYADLKLKAGENYFAKEIALIGLNEIESNPDSNFQSVSNLSKNKTKEKFKHKKPLLQLLYKAHVALGESHEAKMILERLKKDNKNDAFVNKRWS